MNKLELKKIILELQKVKTAKLEMEVKIEEREQEIVRLKEYILVQEKREKELEEQLSNSPVS